MLFVYGTLRGGARNRHMMEQHMVSHTHAWTTGTLYKWDKYPLLVQSGNTKISGELVELRGEEGALKQLDEWEGALYVRKEIEVTIKTGEAKKAWAYIYSGESMLDDAELIE